MRLIASNAAALFPSPRVPSLGKRARFPREGTRGEGNKAAALVAMRLTALSIASRLRLFDDVNNCHGVLSIWRSRTLKPGRYGLYKCRAIFHFKSPQASIIKLVWWVEAIFWKNQRWDFRPTVKTPLWPFCKWFQHLLLRWIWQLLTSKDANGQHILPVGPGGSTLIKKV